MRQKSELLCVASWPKFELQRFAFKIPTYPTSKQFSIFRMSNTNSCELLSCSLFSVSLAAVIALKSSICHPLPVLYAKSPKQTQQSTRPKNSIFTIKIQESRQPKTLIIIFCYRRKLSKRIAIMSNGLMEIYIDEAPN